MEQINIVKTDDGSQTLFSKEFNAHYHSLRGALQESLHIFIQNGYNYLSKSEVNILEVGFGTGLNAALTASRAASLKRETHYTGVELYPPSKLILSELNYSSFLAEEIASNWKIITDTEWNIETHVNEYFSITKVHDDFINLEITHSYDIIYFDAFAPDDQPEMWSESIFKKLYKIVNPEGIIVTYCSKGIVKQGLRKVGFKVERLAGPAGKRHMLRAIHP